MHRVDVVMPAHNTARFIAAAVEGVRAQTFEDWRLLVVDDASTDEMCATVRQAAAGDARVETLKLGANGGAAAARNTGFEATQAPFVAFLDSDDIWRPNALALLTQTLIEAPDAPAAHGLAERMDEDGQPVLVRGRPEVIGTRRP